jgi:DNA polymerase elongation subunit (family B)
MKKKYVARKLTNYDRVINHLDQNLNFNIEYKGIEVVRRDSFELARRFLKRTLEILMNSIKSEPQETYEEIYAYAREVREQFLQISFKDFLFSKQLNKPPKDYARGETIPHVKVALDRIKAGEREETLVNHTIYYIVCKPKEKTQDSLAKLCFDDRAFERSQSNPSLI